MKQQGMPLVSCSHTRIKRNAEKLEIRYVGKIREEKIFDRSFESKNLIKKFQSIFDQIWARSPRLLKEF